MSGPIVYIDRSDVHADRWDELEAAIEPLVAFVERHQPQMLSYGFYLDAETRTMTVVAVHPDSGSLERHVEVGGPEFAKLAPFLSLREIEVFGELSDAARAQLEEKAATLGEGGNVRVHDRFAGFGRGQSSRR